MNKYFHGFLMGVSVLPALAIMPAMAATYTWVHPEGVDSYGGVDSVNSTSSGSADVFTGTAVRNIVDGDVTLTLDGATQTGLTGEIKGVHGNMFLKSSLVTDLGVPALTGEQKLLRQYVDGDVTVVVKNNSSVDRNVIGNQFYIGTPAEITGDIGLSGKTTITIKDSVVKGDVRGANIGDASTSTATEPKLANLKVNDIEINIDNSLVEDEVVSVGAYASAGNVVINVTGDSTIGYDADNQNNRALEGSGTKQADGWIIAGAQRHVGRIESTEINLNTSGTIRIAGDVQAGSRQSDEPEKESDENSVIGNATLNMLGGGNINIGGDVRAYHVGGATELNINNVDVNVVGTVKEFQTINMDENAKLTAGALVLTADDTLNVKLASTDAYSQIIVDNLDANLATLNMTVSGEGTYNVVDAATTTSDFKWNLTNSLYDLTMEEGSGTVVAKLKATEDIAETNDLSEEMADVLSNISQSTSEKLNDLSVKIQEKLAEATPVAKQEVEHAAKAVHPEAGSVVQSVSTAVQTTVSNLVAARMAAPISGRNGGDMNFTSGGVWAQGLFNKSKQNDAFSGYTRGIAAGMDGTINRAWTIGAGYSFAHSDISGSVRDTEIDSNTVFVYGQYKPDAWYVSAIANYTWADYSEEGIAMGTPVTGDYNVDSFGGMLATGYDFDTGITPEVGLRYLHVNGDDYTNSMDVKSKLDSADYLTASLGAKYGFGLLTDSGLLFRPELRAAAKYDLMSDKTTATVLMPGVDAYTLEGERLSRFGGEFGIGLSMKYRSMDISVNYDIDVRKDYTSQTGMLKFRYNF